MTTVILFVFGAIIGSFLNVVALRWDSPRNRGVFSNFGGRSICPSCHKILQWYELVPILSFIFLQARCSGCRAKISWQYPMIEMLTGLIFLSIYNLQYSFYKEFSLEFAVHSSLLLLIFSIYIIIVIYDIYHKIIPDELVYAAIFLSLLVPLFFTQYSLLDWFAGPILFIFFASIWFFSQGRAMGFGDAKLALSTGLLLGASAGFSAIILAFWIGAFGSLIYLFMVKVGFLNNGNELTMKSEVPFAPFIILGTWLSLFFRLNIFHVTLF